jgi:hypothetical protein
MLILSCCGSMMTMNCSLRWLAKSGSDSAFGGGKLGLRHLALRFVQTTAKYQLTHGYTRHRFFLPARTFLL